LVADSNSATGNYSSVVGGRRNYVWEQAGFVGGGEDNMVTDKYGAVAGGRNNRAGDSTGDGNSAYYATVGGGFQNSASGRYATVPGGNNCSAQGQFSFAAGKMAKAMHDGSFVWGDNTTEDFLSERENEFRIRAGNGMVVTANTTSAGVDIENDNSSGSGLYVYNAGSWSGIQVVSHTTHDPWYGALTAYNYGDAPAVSADAKDTGDAGWFNGNVTVLGYVIDWGSAMRIDHPLDPANKYLSHSAVSSPDMMNVYNGNVLLDANGEAWVNLPDWFESLNRDFRYQLTCIGGHADVYVDVEIENNAFKIAGGRAGLKVSWQVTGIRRDPSAEANRVLVEQSKKPNELGKYLDPKAYGQSWEHGIGYNEESERQYLTRASESQR
jgi:hypothetical protein